MTDKTRPLSLLDGAILRPAAADAFSKLNPTKMWRNPVMFGTDLVPA